MREGSVNAFQSSRLANTKFTFRAIASAFLPAKAGRLSKSKCIDDPHQALPKKPDTAVMRGNGRCFEQMLPARFWARATMSKKRRHFQ
jgi:hypothetical protein